MTDIVPGSTAMASWIAGTLCVDSPNLDGMHEKVPAVSTDVREPERHHSGVVVIVLHRFAPLLGLASGLFWIIRRTATDLINDDTYFHLRFGDGFLDGWSLWDPGSPTALATRDWTPTQWLTQVVMAGLERSGGLMAVTLFYGVVLIGYFVVLYAVTRRVSPPIAASVVTLVALIASGPGLSGRPQVFSFILVALFTSSWLATLRDGRIRWWLIPAMWLWTMLHGMWICGLLISMVGALGVVADRSGTPVRRRLRPVLVPAGSLLVTLFTPVGPGFVLETLTVGSRGEYFAEWAPPDFTQPLPMVVALLVLTPLVIWLRHGQVEWTPLLLLLLAGAWAVYTVRTGPVAAAMAAPVAAQAIAMIMPKREMAVPERRFLIVAVPVAILMVLLLAPRGEQYHNDRPEWEAGVVGGLPAGTVVLNEWGWGGYLMWRYPHLDVVISGYGDIYTDEELERNVTLRRTEAEWAEELQTLDVQFAYLDPDSDLAYALVQLRGWEVLAEDDSAQLLRAPAAAAG